MALISASWNPTQRQLRQFGAIALVVFAALGAKVYFSQTLFWMHYDATTAHVIGVALAGLGIACALAAAVAPAMLRPLYVVLLTITWPIGLTVSFVILMVLFYGLISPFGLIMRLFGRDTMQRRLLPHAETYWQPHESVTDVRRYFRQS